MGISPQTVAFLCSLGHDAVHLQALGLDRLSDSAILELARTEKRVLVTHDLDFAELMAAGGEVLPSVVVFRLRSMRPERVGSYLQRIISQHTEALERGAVVSVWKAERACVCCLLIEQNRSKPPNSAQGSQFDGTPQRWPRRCPQPSICGQFLLLRSPLPQATSRRTVSAPRATKTTAKANRISTLGQMAPMPWPLSMMSRSARLA
jgi:predicted nuclease of predicted toxin-antitoxin system